MIDLNKINEIDSIEDRNKRVLEAARYYISEGIWVLPLEKNGKGLPQKELGGINYHSASRKIEVIDKWFGPRGKYEGHNVGIACGKDGGVFAIDVDPKDGGYDTLSTLEGEHAPLDAPYQITPSGGKHYIYSWVPNARSSTSILGKGVDTRGGYEDACAGHIVAWPSVVSDGGGEPASVYVWGAGGEVAPPPAWVPTALGESWRKQKVMEASGLGNENMGADDGETSYSIRQIGNMIKNIDLDNLTYDEWLWIGQAIHSQHPNEKGLELWDKWSKRGSRYESSECSIRWSGFSENGPIRIGSLIHIATEHGDYDPRTQGNEVLSTPEEVLSLVDEVNEKFAVTVIGGSVKIVMMCDPNPSDPLADRYKFLDRSGFLTMMENQKFFVNDAKGNPKLMSKALVWLGEEKRKTYPAGMVFMPDQPPEVNGAFNTWQPWPVSCKQQDQGNWGLFRTHVRDIICKGNESHFTWLMDWMADIIQNPTKPKGSALVMSGKEGTGKGTLALSLIHI